MGGLAALITALVGVLAYCQQRGDGLELEITRITPNPPQNGSQLFDVAGTARGLRPELQIFVLARPQGDVSSP